MVKIIALVIKKESVGKTTTTVNLGIGLAKLGDKRPYDYVLIDCTPALGMMTINALAAADSAIIPVQPH